MQLTDLKDAYLYSYFYFLSRGNFPNGYLAAQLFAEHIQAAERFA